MKPNKFPLFLLISYMVLFIWSLINPHDYGTWFMEVLPAIIGIGIMIVTYKRFPLTNMFYFLAWLHAIVLTVGGHYTYAEVPLFNWLRDIGIFERNNYDKIGHFVQGFFPAIYAREILLRTSPLVRGKWLAFIIVSIAGLITAIYEIIEWLTAVILGDKATDFLGTQGYIYDTQSDMFLCIVGALLSVLLLSRLHDKSMEYLAKK